jgi:hypothetical protein
VLCATVVVHASDASAEPDSELLRYHERYQRQSHNAYEHEWISTFDHGVVLGLGAHAG